MTRWWLPNEKRANFDGPYILHYINPTYSETSRKFSQLGNFGDISFDRRLVPKGVPTEGLPKEGRGLTSHLKVRDIFSGLQSVKMILSKLLVAQMPEQHRIADYIKMMGELDPQKIKYYKNKGLLLTINNIRKILGMKRPFISF